jgi:hypothetical protein
MLIDNAASGALLGRAAVYAEHGAHRPNYDIPSTFWRAEHASDGRHEIANERRFAEANWMLSSFKLMWAARDFDMYDLREGLSDGHCAAASIVSFPRAAIEMLLESIESCFDVAESPLLATGSEPQMSSETGTPQGGPISDETKFEAFVTTAWTDRAYTKIRLREIALGPEFGLSSNGFDRVMNRVRGSLGSRPVGRPSAAEK